MANKRKPISKKVRFEVFKRDKFTCQYCGRSAPDVILQIDHIKPVSKGGENNILNYVTSCRDCNLGKGARELSDNSAIKKQQQQLIDLAEKNEQLEMMLKWREELQLFNTSKVDAINDYIGEHYCWCANENGQKKIKLWLRKFPLDMIFEAIDISYEQYFDGSKDSWEKAFDKIGGICTNKTYDLKHGNNRYYYNYFAKACANKYTYWSEEMLHRIVDDYILDDEQFEIVKSIFRRSRYWNVFVNNVEEYFGKG